MRLKNSGIAFLALIATLSVLVSCGAKLDTNDFDWALYTNTEWRSEASDADLNFKDTADGIVFDLFISKICIAENAQTTGKLKSTETDYVDSFNCEYGDISIKGSITFSPDGDYLIVTITKITGDDITTGDYRFEKVIENTYTIEDVCWVYVANIIRSEDDFDELSISLNQDGTARMLFCAGEQLNEDTIGTFTIEKSQIIFKRLYVANGSGDPYDTTTPYKEAVSGADTGLPETTTFDILDKDTLEIQDDYFTAFGLSVNQNLNLLSRYTGSLITANDNSNESGNGGGEGGSGGGGGSDDAFADITMPNLVGMTSRQADDTLRANHLFWGSSNGEFRYTGFVVTWQSAPAGTKVPFGSFIDLEFRATAPNVVGKSYSQAKDTMLASGFGVTYVYVPGSQPMDTVIAQSISPGTKVAELTAVTLTLSDGSQSA